MEFAFQVRPGEPVDLYDFELVIADSYSGATLVRKLAIPRRDKEDLRPFPNGVDLTPPTVTASITEADSGKQAGIRIMAVGLQGEDFDASLLLAMASSPQGKYVVKDPQLLRRTYQLLDRELATARSRLTDVVESYDPG